MPELPEVETVCRALAPHLVGRRIVGVSTFTDRLRGPIRELEHCGLRNSLILSLRRRARYLLLDLDPAAVLLVHLGMTGSCRVVPGGTALARHEHVEWELDDGRLWRFRDPRRFGVVRYFAGCAAGGVPPPLAGLGPEPLSDGFDAEHLQRFASGRRAAIKAVIMDNRCVVGVGNIYASEALFRAGIRPTAAAGSVSMRRLRRLVAAIREVLSAAIAAGGTTISDYRAPDGSEGRFAQDLRVYGREREPCDRCGRAIRRVVFGGRSAFFCPGCQQ